MGLGTTFSVREIESRMYGICIHCRSPLDELVGLFFGQQPNTNFRRNRSNPIQLCPIEARHHVVFAVSSLRHNGAHSLCYAVSLEFDIQSATSLRRIKHFFKRGNSLAPKAAFRATSNFEH